MKRTYKLLLLMVMVVGMFGMFHPQASAVSKLTVKKSGSYLYVKSGSKTKYKVAYHKQKVKITSATSARTGPSKKYYKAHSLKKGKKVKRVGQLSSKKWDIIKMNGNYYFVARKRLAVVASSSSSTTATSSSALYTPSYFKKMGIISWNGWRWTWYSQKVLPGHGLRIPGRHVDSNGYVCDENGYICLASSSLSWGTVVKTPFGRKGRVYDSGCARDILDVYVNW